MTPYATGASRAQLAPDHVVLDPSSAWPGGVWLSTGGTARIVDAFVGMELRERWSGRDAIWVTPDHSESGSGRTGKRQSGTGSGEHHQQVRLTCSSLTRLKPAGCFEYRPGWPLLVLGLTMFGTWVDLCETDSRWQCSAHDCR
ncbi:hypothetical protein PF003_g35396 [Phytophthora fragariae]|nr:hypothetical protein PF003_g35396 [Phytophthora fragariae]